MDYQALLRGHALSLEGAFEDFPFGEHDAVYKAANQKIFLFLSSPGAPVQVSLKLTPEEVLEAQGLPFVGPVRYLSKKHWISAKVNSEPEFDIVLAWVNRSYELVAPKRKSVPREAAVE